MHFEEEHIVRIGPAGWSYDDWKGIVYPAPMPRGTHALELLCEYFDTVEINSSFYRPPNPKYCETWLRKVESNPRFKFTAKLWQRFTHERERWPSQEEAAEFVRGIAPLDEAGKLGAVLIQFPWSFKRSAGNRQWLARVIDTFQAYPLALELRHASWDLPEVYEGLRERGVAFCNIDQPLFENSIGPSERVTAPLAYVRLHGRNHNDWFREDAGRDDRYNYLYSPEELKPWIAKIETIREQAKEIYAITNNHYRGQAVVNAFDLQEGLGKRDFALPQSLVDTYPQLSRLLQEQSTTD